MRVLFDLNIILDVLANRMPYYEDAAKIWVAAEEKEIEGLLAAHSITTLYYLLTRYTNRQQAVRAVNDVLQVFSIAAVNKDILRQALALAWNDFEDAVQMAAALQAGADYLVTRNPKDFKSGAVTVLLPGEFFALLHAHQ